MADIDRQVQVIFDNTIKLEYAEGSKHQDWRSKQSFLLSHERKQFIITNLIAQIKEAERRQMSIIFKINTYGRLIEDMCKLWSRLCLLKRDQENLSHNEKIRLLHESDRIKRAEEMMQDLEKETLHANKDSDWAVKRQTEIQKARAADEVPRVVLPDANEPHG